MNDTALRADRSIRAEEIRRTRSVTAPPSVISRVRYAPVEPGASGT